MATAYLVQTYQLPGQALRLARTLRTGSPGCTILVSHDRDAPEGVDPGMSDVADAVLTGPGGRGDFATLDRYLACLDRLERDGRDVDWVVNITGQDYPVVPPARIESELAASPADAHLEFYPVMDPGCRWGPREGRDRYGYRYRWLRPSLGERPRRVLRPLQALNRVQPWWRVTTSYGLAVGRRVGSPPFDARRPCYGGSFYGALSRRAVTELRRAMADEPGLVEHYRRTLVPEESLLQTVLVGSPRIAVRNHAGRYWDFRGSVAGRPRTLTVADLPAMLSSGAWFARKFDERVDAEVLDRLDEHLAT